MAHKLLIAAVLLIGTGCQHANLLIDEADLSRLDECIALQHAQAKRIDAQAAELAAIRKSVDRDNGAAVLQRLDDLALHMAVVQTELARECPDPTAGETLARPALEKLVVGDVENVRFENLDLVLRARIDTGASTSSLDARDIGSFERDGDRWVRFTVLDPESGEPLVLERPRSRRVRILQATADEPERRPVVEMRVTLGDNTQTAEFTLSNRSNLEFPVLIGRNILRDLMVVDVSKRDAAPLPPREERDPNNGADS